MATANPTQGRSILAPPTERYSLLGWLRKNLFGSLLDAILTLLSLGLLYLVLRPLLGWIFSADWSVIPANFALILRGPYPPEAVGRLWLALYLLFGLVGLSWGAWFKRFEPVTILVLVIPALLALIPFIEFFNRLNLLVGEAVMLVAYGVGRFWPRARNGWIGYLWILYLLATPVLFGGSAPLGLLPLAPTNLWGVYSLPWCWPSLALRSPFPLVYS